MLGTLRNKFVRYNDTCPITKLRDKCVTFIRGEKYIPYLRYAKEDVWVIAHPDWEKQLRKYQSDCCPTVNIYYSEWPEYEFTLYHNYLQTYAKPRKPFIGDYCNIHQTVVMDIDGLKVVHGPKGEKIQFIHSGYVMIGDYVDIGPYTVIHRGTMEGTSIARDCKIGALNNIGHNCYLGKGTVLAAGVVLNGGVYTGKNCWFGSRSVVKHHVTITDNVVIGMGAVVTKDIKESGIYVGNPAKYLKPVEEGWNF